MACMLHSSCYELWDLWWDHYLSQNNRSAPEYI
jgi:hypothetical protein